MKNRRLIFLLLLACIARLEAQSWTRTYELVEQPNFNEDIGVSVLPYADKLWLLSNTQINDGTQGQFGIFRLNPEDGAQEAVGSMWGDPRHLRVFYIDAMVPVPDGVVAGGDWYVGQGINNYDIFLTKFDQDLNLEWSRNYEGYYMDFVRTVLDLPQGGYLIQADGRGEEHIYGGYRGDITLLRTDDEGHLLWQRRLYLDTLCVRPQYGNIERLSDGGYALCFQGYDFPSSGTTGFGWDHPWLARLDSTGALLWARKYEAMYTGAIPFMRVMPDGNMVMVSEIYTTVTSLDTLTDGRIVRKLDPEGNVLWEKLFSRDVRREYASIRLTQAGDILISGWYNDPRNSPTVGSGWLAKLSGTTGQLLWERKYVLASHPFEYLFVLYGVSELPDGNLVVCGVLRDTIAGFNPPTLGPGDAWVMKLDSNGCFTPGPCGFDNLVRLTEAPAWVADISAFPNPSGASPVYLRLPQEANGQLGASLYDAQGRRLASWQEVYDNQAISLPADTGIYYLLLKDKGGQIIHTLPLVRQ